MNESVTEKNITNVKIEISGCDGYCSQGPKILIEPDDIFYTQLKEQNIDQIVGSHLENNETIRELTYFDPKSQEYVTNYGEIPFYKKQKRMILDNCGKINPEKIDDYLEVGGYTALRNALTMSQQEIIDIIKKSGLRGRGGAGFSTGLKWEFCFNAPGKEKYVIINADEGDPGAFMDRSILEADPHSVLEGLIIGGYAIGASHGMIYIRSEYPLAIERFKKTIESAKEHGFLGENILSSAFSFDVSIHKGAGAFVCGEETALIASIEGLRGQPRQRPPFPATSGLWGKPTNINNVKSWAFVTWILKNGWEEFRKVGVENSPGTAIFSLTGKIKNAGLIEVAMGTTLREIIFDIGGGILNDRQFKAVQTGGPSGGCLPSSLLDTPVDYDSMAMVHSIMGSGGMVVIDEDNCIVDFAKYFLKFTQKESCGKCVPCREGTLRALEILDKITEGNAEISDFDDLLELCEIIKVTSLCGLGQSAPNPVLSTLRYFKEEYLEHIIYKKCRAGVCPPLFKFIIDDDECNNCSRCKTGCSFNAISGSKETGFLIHDEICEGCRVCFETCPTKAIKIGWKETVLPRGDD
jgi:NADH:ubiquinone oxidoreductase subunit F (NADH-binding)/(2Fe-2S) ferredoxin/Pyruvate/2-oxoacid:ferredoxin oxidoreductase delta subunit